MILELNMQIIQVGSLRDIASDMENFLSLWTMKKNPFWHGFYSSSWSFSRHSKFHLVALWDLSLPTYRHQMFVFSFVVKLCPSDINIVLKKQLWLYIPQGIVIGKQPCIINFWWELSGKITKPNFLCIDRASQGFFSYTTLLTPPLCDVGENISKFICIKKKTLG